VNHDNKRYSILGLLRDPVFRELLGIVRTHRRLYAAAVGSQLALTVLALGFAETSRRLFNLAPHVPAHALTVLLGVILLIAALRLGATFVNNWVSSLLNETVVYEMRRTVLNQLQRLPLAFHEANHSSKASNALYYELEMVKEFVVSDIQKLIALPISFVFVAVYLLTVHPLLGAVAMCIGPLQLLSSLVLKRRFQEAVDLQRKASGDVFFTIGETLQGVREVKANQMEARIDARMAEIQTEGVASNVLLTKVTSWRAMARNVPSEIGYVVGVGLGAVLMARGAIGVGGLIAFITLLDKVSVPFTTVAGIVNNLQQTIAGARHLFTVMGLPVEEQTHGVPLAPHPLIGPEIAFEDVTFGYTAERRTLDAVRFRIPAGASLALVGPSGAGKSTLIKLLYRFYAPDSGTIRVDGRPLDSYRLDTVRGAMALVSQEIFLFDGTVADNIAAGRDGATREEIERAARLAQAEPFIRDLPNGYDTHVGERGIKLSHGQRQRLSIARAILRQASILILDEPTSALDVETEASFQRDLGEWADHCTQIIIAHRLSTIRAVDHILFLEDGQVVEYGTPAELLAANGRFARFWERQSAFQEVPAVRAESIR
jgi:ABC-type multidrug transport system fused ATPase/permease subunit